MVVGSRRTPHSASSCAPDSHRFVELEESAIVEANSFHICPETCEDFFQACIDVTPERFVNAQTFCEAQRLDNGLKLRVRDYSCFGAGRIGASPENSFAHGAGLYGGAANQVSLLWWACATLVCVWSSNSSAPAH